MPVHSARLLSVGLRMSSLALRSVLVFLLARYLPPSDIGLYGLLVVTVAYAMYPLGLDFYTYSTREMLRSDRGRWHTYLRSHTALTVALYAVLAPVMALAFATDLLPWSVAPWFFLLVMFEHLGAELDRVLVAAGNQLGASVCLFIRQAVMPLIVIPLIAVADPLRSLDLVLGAWVVLDAVAAFAGWLIVRRLLAGSSRGFVDWKWIWTGIRVCVPFLIGTLCLRALFTVDRQIVKVDAGLEVLGAYTLFMAFGAAMTNLIGVGIHQFTYPHLVAAAHRQDWAVYVKTIRSMAVQTVAVAGCVALVVTVCLPFALHVVRGAVYDQYAWTVPWILATTALYNCSLVSHYALYALDADRVILAITVGALGCFVAVVSLLGTSAPVQTVLAAIATASAVLLVGKTVAARRHYRTAWRETEMAEGGAG